MTLDRLLENAGYQLRTLRVLHTMPHHIARAVVDQNQCESRAAIDVPVYEVQVPQVIRAHRFEALVVRLALTFGGR